MWQCQRVQWSWHAKLREFKASPLAKRRLAKPGTKTGHYLCRSPQGWFEDDDTTARARRLNICCIEMQGRKNRSRPKGCGTLAARRNHQTALGTFLKCVKERALPLVEDVEVDGASVAYSNDCIVQRVQHHFSSQLLAAVMDRWPSFSRIGSSKLPRFLRCLKLWRQFTPARTRRAMPTPVWEGIATQLTLLKHPHMARRHFDGNVHPSIRAFGIWKEGSCPTACAISPMLVGRARCFGFFFGAEGCAYCPDSFLNSIFSLS